MEGCVVWKGGELFPVSVDEVGEVAEVADVDVDGGEGLTAERGSLDATRECLKVRVGEGGWSDRGCLPPTDADADGEATADDDGEGEPISMMLRRLEL